MVEAIIWLDWMAYAYGFKLIVTEAAFVSLYWMTRRRHSYAGMFTTVFLGGLTWVLGCLVFYGTAVG